MSKKTKLIIGLSAWAVIAIIAAAAIILDIPDQSRPVNPA